MKIAYCVLRGIFISVLCFFGSTGANGQLWFEDFSGEPNGTQSGTAGGTLGGTWSVDIDPGGTFAVQGDAFRINNTPSEGTWSSDLINISSVGYAIIDLEVLTFGIGFGASDYLAFYYRLDGGPEVQFAYAEAAFLSATTSNKVSAIVAANTLELIIKGRENSLLGYITVDNVTVTAAPIIYSRASGSWTNAVAGTGTWSLTGHTGASCACYPLNTQVAIIGAGHTVTLSASQTNIGTPPTTNLAPGAVDVYGTLQYTNTAILGIQQGLVRVRSGGTVNSSSAAIIGEQVSFNANLGGATLQVDAGGTMSVEDLVLGTNATNLHYLTGGGTLTITDDILIDATGGTLTNNRSAAFTVSGDVDFNGANSTFVNNAAMTISGDILMDANNSAFTNNATSLTITDDLNFNSINSAFTNNATASIADIVSTDNADDDNVVINSVGATLMLGGVNANNADIDVLNSGTITQSGNFSNISNADTNFDNLATGTWNWTLTPNTTFDTDMNTVLNCTAAGNIFNYSGTGAQSIIPATYYHLTLSNSGDKLTSATLDVNGNLLIQNTAVLSSAANAIDVEGNITIQNTATLGNGTSTGTINIGGNWSAVNAASYVQGSRTVNFDGGAAQTIGNTSGTETFGNLTLSGSGIKSSPNIIDIDGNLSIAGTAQFSVSNNINLSGNWTVTSTNPNPFIEGTQTVTLDGAGTQTISTVLVAGETFNNLTLSGGGVVSNTSILDINGNLLISGSGQLSAGNNISLAGNWDVTGTNTNPFVEGTRTVTFDGNTQSLATSLVAGETFYNLTISNTGASPLITLSRNVTVSNVLTMTRGNVNLNGNTVRLTSTAAGALLHSLASSAGWMYGGSFARTRPASTAFGNGVGAIANARSLFPLGSANDWRPFFVGQSSNANTAGTITVSHVNSTSTSTVSIGDPAPGTIIRRRHNSYWSVTTTGISAGATFTLQAGGTTFGTVANSSHLRMATSTGVVGTHIAGSGGPTDWRVNRSVTFANLVNNFHVSSTDAANSPLPIQLLSFTAQLKNNEVELKWSTASETNNDFFTIERATDVEHFEPILTSYGKGTTKELNQYTLVDSSPRYGRSYYRLKQTDFDGKFTYSELRTIDYEGSHFAILTAFPNPVNTPTVTIKIEGLQEATEVPVQILNMQGQKVFEKVIEIKTPGILTEEISRNNFPNPGLYIIKAGETLYMTRKIVIE